MKNKSFLSFLFMFCLYGLYAQTQENVTTHKVGDYTINLLSEGQQKGSISILIDAPADVLSKFVPDGTFPNAVNAFLIQTPDKNILVDAGFGRELFTNLESLGINAAGIDIILLTHMHGDHIGGLMKDGKPTFCNAQLYIPKPEHDYWTSDDKMMQLPENRRGNFNSARDVIKAYKNRLTLVNPAEIETFNEEFIPGFKAIAAYGHTPGHTVYLFESGGEQMMIWGDLTHAMAVQMPHPEIAVTYDVDPKTAIQYRQKILNFAATQKIPIAGMHIAYPGMGKITKTKEGGYYYTPL